MKEKLKSSRGLTLVEMLCAVAVLTLLVLILNSGFHLALTSYRNLTIRSETALLLSTLSNALADDLRYARDIKTSTDDRLISYSSDSYNGDKNSTSLEVDSDTGYVTANGMRILPAGAYGNGAYRVAKLDITWREGLFTLTLAVSQTGGTVSAETEFTVRSLSG